MALPVSDVAQPKESFPVLEGHAFDVDFQKVAITRGEGFDWDSERLAEIHAARHQTSISSPPFATIWETIEDLFLHIV